MIIFIYVKLESFYNFVRLRFFVKLGYKRQRTIETEKGNKKEVMKMGMMKGARPIKDTDNFLVTV
jgi:hypothetical protein